MRILIVIIVCAILGGFGVYHFGLAFLFVAMPIAFALGYWAADE